MSELPDSWTRVPLAMVGSWGSGGTPTRTNDQYYAKQGIPWLVIGDLNDRVVLKSSNFITELGLANSSAKLVPTGALLVAMYGSIGKLGITGIECATNQAIAFCKPDESIVSLRYLYHAMFNAKPDLLALGQGGAQQNISQSVLKEFQIPLAPKNEQTRISDLLDTLFARVQACNDRFDAILALLKRFRQTIYMAAVSGTLSEDWRAANRVNDWTHERAADVCAKVQSGGTPKEGFSARGVPFLKVYNIVNQKVAFDYKPQYIESSIHHGSMAKSRTQPGDVLMNIVGPPLGKVAIVPADRNEWNINQAITLFRPSERISTGWLYCILCSGVNIADIIHETRGSAGQVNISLSQCRDFRFPVPTVIEQAEIVRRVGALLALADRIETRCTAARAQAQRLTPLVLAKAFRGELVPQDPEDESANDLLNRIAVAQAPTPKIRIAKAAARQTRKVKLQDLNPFESGDEPLDATMKLDSIPSNYLETLVPEAGGLNAKELWQKSKLGIDDFYVQLGKEIDRGLLEIYAHDESRICRSAANQRGQA
jgi:type I restriction enzyme, S subunit